MHVVLLSGSPSARSRTELLLEYVNQRLQVSGLEVSLLRVRDFPAEALLHADFASLSVQQLQAVVASADGLVVATPVYKASFTGALKVLLDLLPTCWRWTTR
jgi:FMN reductase